jgi:hypothetical protein
LIITPIDAPCTVRVVRLAATLPLIHVECTVEVAVRPAVGVKLANLALERIVLLQKHGLRRKRTERTHQSRLPLGIFSQFFRVVLVENNKA